MTIKKIAHKYPAFKECMNLTSVTIPKSVEIVHDSAFSGCEEMTSLTIEGNTVFEDMVFYDCIGLTDESINVKGRILYTTDKC